MPSQVVRWCWRGGRKQLDYQGVVSGFLSSSSASHPFLQYTNRSWCKACSVHLSQSCISAAWHFLGKEQKWIMWTSYGPTELHTPLYSVYRMLEWCARRRLRQEHTRGAVTLGVDGSGEKNKVRGEGRKQGLNTFSARAHTHTYTRAVSFPALF